VDEEPTKKKRGSTVLRFTCLLCVAVRELYAGATRQEYWYDPTLTPNSNSIKLENDNAQKGPTACHGIEWWEVLCSFSFCAAAREGSAAGIRHEHWNDPTLT